jgi:LysR family transcriptional regulator for bpeEF and oprC
VQRIVGEIADAEADVMRFGEQPRGRLRISVGAALATYALVGALPEFTARYPEITLDLVITEYPVDLIDSGIDAAIRIGPLGDVNLVARRVGDLERVISAAPTCLERHGALGELRIRPVTRCAWPGVEHLRMPATVLESAPSRL